jgi:hypothetical protein
MLLFTIYPSNPRCPPEINSVSGAEKQPQFIHAVMQEFTVTEISLFNSSLAAKNTTAALLVTQSFQPFGKRPAILILTVLEKLAPILKRKSLIKEL